MNEDREIAKRLRAFVADLEWAGTVWTDCPCCLACGRLWEGLPMAGLFKAEPPKTHKTDCEWVRLMKESAYLTVGQ